MPRNICYMLVVTGGHPEADLLKSRCIEVVGSVDQSGINKERGSAFVRFRCEASDQVAQGIATQIAGDVPFSLVTGYGFHQRVVA